MKYKYLFGPVLSRRLGRSLGIDLVPPKTCSMDCLYCECGKTTLLTNRRKRYVPTAEVQKELEHLVSQGIDLDCFTFSGAGEPTLHRDIGLIIETIKTLQPGVPVVVLTNGTLLGQPDVINDLQNADIVIPSLDASLEDTFSLINRPTEGLSLKQLVEGMVGFRRAFQGEIWLETFIIEGINDSPNEIKAFIPIIQTLQPDRIQLNRLDRPGTVRSLKTTSVKGLQQIKNTWELECEIPVDIIANKVSVSIADMAQDEIEARIIALISRRPCTVKDLQQALGITENHVTSIIRKLKNSHDLVCNKQSRGLFYSLHN